MPPFDDAQLTDLAGVLGHPVPADYQALMAAFPADLADKLYRGLTRKISDHELYVDPAKVVERNQWVRADKCWGEEGESAWEPAHLVIGMDMSGDAIFVDAAAGGGPVHRYLCDSGRAIEVAPDVATYARMLATDDPALRKS